MPVLMCESLRTVSPVEDAALISRTGVPRSSYLLPPQSVNGVAYVSLLSTHTTYLYLPYVHDGQSYICFFFPFRPFFAFLFYFRRGGSGIELTEQFFDKTRCGEDDGMPSVSVS